MVHDINEVIADLAQIDNASSRIMESVRKEKNQYAEEYKHKTEVFDTDLSHSEEKHLSEFQTSLSEENHQKLEQSAKDAKELLSGMNEAYERNKDAWVDAVFHKIISEPMS